MLTIDPKNIAAAATVLRYLTDDALREFWANTNLLQTDEGYRKEVVGGLRRRGVMKKVDNAKLDTAARAARTLIKAEADRRGVELS